MGVIVRSVLQVSCLVVYEILNVILFFTEQAHYPAAHDPARQPQPAPVVTQQTNNNNPLSVSAIATILNAYKHNSNTSGNLVTVGQFTIESGKTNFNLNQGNIRELQF